MAPESEFRRKSPCGDDFWYEGWNGHYNLVKLNLRNPGVCDHLIDAVNYWIEEFKIDAYALTPPTVLSLISLKE